MRLRFIKINGKKCTEQDLDKLITYFFDKYQYVSADDKQICFLSPIYSMPEFIARIENDNLIVITRNKSIIKHLAKLGYLFVGE